VARMASPRLLAAAAATLTLSLLAAGCHTAPPVRPQAQSARDTSALTVTAEAALQKGDCRTAAEDYAAAADGGTVDLARRASQVALACQDFPAAWQAARRWHTLAPADRDASLIYGTVALTLYRVPAARSAFAPIVKATGPRATRDTIALIELLSDDPDVGASPAFAALDSAVDAKSAAPPLLAAFGELALEAYDFSRAELRAREVLASNADSSSGLRLLARVRALEGDAPGALAAARQATQADPSGNAFEVADVLTDLGRLEEARQELERLRSSDVAVSEIDQRLALLSYESGDLADAKRRFTALLDHGEASASALLYLGDIAARSGDEDTALTDYRQLSDTSMALRARTRAAQILADRGKRGEALDLLDSYESEHPEGAVDVAIAKADLLADHGDAAGGLPIVAAALQRFPQQPRLEYERATLLERAGQVDQSVKAFEGLLRGRPGDPNLLNALGYTLADHHLELGRAEGLIRRALSAEPDNPAMLDSLGWVRLRRGDVRSSLPDLARAYEISRDPEIAAHWGEALWVSGQKAQARKVWAEALARNPDSQPLKDTVHRLVASGTS